MRGFGQDETAVSLSVGFILTFSITVLVLVTILTSFYSLMDQAEQTVMHDQFEIHGSDIAVKITNIDTIVSSASGSGSSIGEIRYSLRIPDKIAGKYYSVEFSDQTDDIIFMSEGREETKVKVPYSADSVNITPATLYSSEGEHYMVYNPATNTIEIN